MSKKPNVLFIMADQWNESCFSGFSHPDVKTPNLDKLIDGGVSFRNCFVTNPTCQPSRTSFFTGQYIHTHGISSNGTEAVIKSKHHSLAQTFKDQGYKTGAFGKLHLGKFDKSAGFDEIQYACDAVDAPCQYYEYLKELGLYDDYMKNERQAGKDLARKFWAQKSNLPMEHTNENWTADRTMDFINNDDDQPFFAWCTFERPHAPHTPPKDTPIKYDPNKLNIPDYDSKYFESKMMHSRPGLENLWKASVQGEDALRNGLACYYELMSLIDYNIGRLIDSLKENGMFENTIIIFTADHGDFAGEYGMLGKNSSNYDAISRSPYLWYWHDKFDKNQFFELVESIDLYPTLCDLVGIDTPITVQGTSHIDAMTDSKYFAGKNCVFTEKFFTKTARSRTHKLTLHCNGENVTGELYDLVEDPKELINKFDDPCLAHIQKELSQQIISWYVRTEQPAVYKDCSEILDSSLRWHSNILS